MITSHESNNNLENVLKWLIKNEINKIFYFKSHWFTWTNERLIVKMPKIEWMNATGSAVLLTHFHSSSHNINKNAMKLIMGTEIITGWWITNHKCKLKYFLFGDKYL